MMGKIVIVVALLCGTAFGGGTETCHQKKEGAASSETKTSAFGDLMLAHGVPGKLIKIIKTKLAEDGVNPEGAADFLKSVPFSPADYPATSRFLDQIEKKKPVVRKLFNAAHDVARDAAKLMTVEPKPKGVSKATVDAALTEINKLKQVKDALQPFIDDTENYRKGVEAARAKAQGGVKEALSKLVIPAPPNLELLTPPDISATLHGLETSLTSSPGLNVDTMTPEEINRLLHYNKLMQGLVLHSRGVEVAKGRLGVLVPTKNPFHYPTGPTYTYEEHDVTTTYSYAEMASTRSMTGSSWSRSFSTQGAAVGFFGAGAAWSAQMSDAHAEENSNEGQDTSKESRKNYVKTVSTHSSTMQFLIGTADFDLSPSLEDALLARQDAIKNTCEEHTGQFECHTYVTGQNDAWCEAAGPRYHLTSKATRGFSGCDEKCKCCKEKRDKESYTCHRYFALHNDGTKKKLCQAAGHHVTTFTSDTDYDKKYPGCKKLDWTVVKENFNDWAKLKSELSENTGKCVCCAESARTLRSRVVRDITGTIEHNPPSSLTIEIKPACTEKDDELRKILYDSSRNSKGLEILKKELPKIMAGTDDYPPYLEEDQLAEASSLLQEFGSHFATSAKLGGSYYTDTTISATASDSVKATRDALKYADSHSKSGSVSVAAAGVYGAGAGSVGGAGHTDEQGYSYKYDDENKDMAERYANTHVHVVGGRYGTHTEWRQEMDTNPDSWRVYDRDAGDYVVPIWEIVGKSHRLDPDYAKLVSTQLEIAWHGVLLTREQKENNFTAFVDEAVKKSVDPEKVDCTPVDCKAVPCKFIGSAPVVAAIVENNKIYLRAADGTSNWTPVSVSCAAAERWTSVTMSADGKKLAAVGDDTNVWLSENSGVDWNEVRVANNQGRKKWRSIASSHNGKYLVATEGPGGSVWRSNNYGRKDTWQYKEVKTNWALTHSSNEGGGQYTDVKLFNSNSQWHRVVSSADGEKIALFEYGHIHIKYGWHHNEGHNKDYFAPIVMLSIDSGSNYKQCSSDKSERVTDWSYRQGPHSRSPDPIGSC